MYNGPGAGLSGAKSLADQFSEWLEDQRAPARVVDGHLWTENDDPAPQRSMNEPARVPEPRDWDSSKPIGATNMKKWSGQRREDGGLNAFLTPQPQGNGLPEEEDTSDYSSLGLQDMRQNPLFNDWMADQPWDPLVRRTD